VFVSGPHAGQSIPLLQTTLTIGREHDNNIEIKDPDVARYHARILNERGEFVVEDMASSTGTWVNGERAQRATLGHGDVIRIGQTEIAVDFEWASNSLERAGVDPTA
jgi:pSer/pThr/pTyr-binding forkhead associated (FHA) protein